MKIPIRLFRSLCVLATLAGVLRAGDFAGTWIAQRPTEGGTMVLTIEIKEGADKALTGTSAYAVAGMSGQAKLTGIIVDGDTISFSDLMSYPGVDVRSTYVGVVKGDELKLMWTPEGAETRELVARKKP